MDAGLAAEVGDLTPAVTETPAAVTEPPARVSSGPTPPPAKPPRTRPLVARPAASPAPPTPPTPPTPPAPVAKAAKARKAARAKKALPAEVWVEPTGTTCPPSHPVKAKLSSRLFHLPGMFAYDRTRPDRCYSGPDTAIEDGFIQAKR
ncbi:MAG: hypothetical protein NVSMB12_20330 [Acidimicrobiales bacterium]